MNDREEIIFGLKIFSVFFVIVVLVTAFTLWGWPRYNVYRKTLFGEAELKQAEWNRQIKVKEAQATFESSKSLANAEIERAKGVAKANEIIGSSLENNHQYLIYLYIQALMNNHNNVIYVPTEASLPILEAGKRPKTNNN